MKACVVYFSLSGNTRRFAEAISSSLNIPIFDLTASKPTMFEKFDAIILGTPVHGFSPAKRVSSFVENLPEENGKKIIIFCTYVISKGKTLEKLEKKLESKGYNTILKLSKRGLKPKKEDFSDLTEKIRKAL